MKNCYEKNIDKIMNDINNSKKQNSNKSHSIYKNKNLKNEYKTIKNNSKLKNDSNNNYLNQTSSSLYKINKTSSSNKSNKLLLNNNKYIYLNKTQRRTKSLLDNEKLNIICHKNLINENINKNLQHQKQNIYGYYPQPEPFPKTINYNFSINNNLKNSNNNTISKEESNSIPNTIYKKEDSNILYLLMNLNLGNLYNIFISNCISFNDLFLLTKEDFIEMKIPIGPRNRIMHFLLEYKKIGIKFDFMELSNFLNYYKKIMDKPNMNDANIIESFFQKENKSENKENFNNLNESTKEKGLSINENSNNTEKKLINISKEKEMNNDCHKLKKYNSVNFYKNKDKNINIKKQSHLFRKTNEKKEQFINKMQKYNSFKNSYTINKDNSNKRNSYDLLCQKFDYMNQKVNDFQKNYSRIQKYSKYIDGKISEFLGT